eukprot:TRINITY_DN3167_c0_g1_i1.p1 TRINITY_DN3167_c0_g1~~TRINITY_DN3167_c0_g1_i1.p1  ORF type:complete len:227 (+),score=47.40 TRINITY_DN3167_c0_g1_i1:159-839(+)
MSTSANDKVKVRQFNVNSLGVWKVFGTESSALEYFEAAEARRPPSSSPSDWGNSLYFQFDVSHTLGTINYRFDQGYSLARLWSIKFENLNVVIADDLHSNFLIDGKVTGKEKATLLKQLLGFDESKMLMDCLGEKGSALCIRETENEWELVLPASLISSTGGSCTQTAVHEFKPNSSFPCVAFHRTCAKEGEGEGKWIRVADESGLIDVVAKELAKPFPSWLTQSQ